MKTLFTPLFLLLCSLTNQAQNLTQSDSARIYIMFGIPVFNSFTPTLNMVSPGNHIVQSKTLGENLAEQVTLSFNVPITKRIFVSTEIGRMELVQNLNWTQQFQNDDLIAINGGSSDNFAVYNKKTDYISIGLGYLLNKGKISASGFTFRKYIKVSLDLHHTTGIMERASTEIVGDPASRSFSSNYPDGYQGLQRGSTISGGLQMHWKSFGFWIDARYQALFNADLYDRGGFSTGFHGYSFNMGTSISLKGF